jgi:hypothetical protein
MWQTWKTRKMAAMPLTVRHTYHTNKTKGGTQSRQLLVNGDNTIETTPQSKGNWIYVSKYIVYTSRVYVRWALRGEAHL